MRSVCRRRHRPDPSATPHRRHHSDASGSRYRPGFCGSRAVPEWFHWISGQNRLMSGLAAARARGRL